MIFEKGEAPIEFRKSSIKPLKKLVISVSKVIIETLACFYKKQITLLDDVY